MFWYPSATTSVRQCAFLVAFGVLGFVIAACDSSASPQEETNAQPSNDALEIEFGEEAYVSAATLRDAEAPGYLLHSAAYDESLRQYSAEFFGGPGLLLSASTILLDSDQEADEYTEGERARLRSEGFSIVDLPGLGFESRSEFGSEVGEVVNVVFPIGRTVSNVVVVVEGGALEEVEALAQSLAQQVFERFGDLPAPGDFVPVPNDSEITAALTGIQVVFREYRIELERRANGQTDELEEAFIPVVQRCEVARDSRFVSLWVLIAKPCNRHLASLSVAQEGAPTTALDIARDGEREMQGTLDFLNQD